MSRALTYDEGKPIGDRNYLLKEIVMKGSVQQKTIYQQIKYSEGGDCQKNIFEKF